MSPWALVGRAVPNASSELMSLCGAIKHLLAWPGCVGQLIPMEFLWLANKAQSSLKSCLSSWVWQCHSSVDAYF